MKLEVEDVFFMSLRFTIAAFLIYELGLIYGFVLCNIISYAHSFVMWKIFGL